ncbi:MAG: trigger factor [Minisyncoccia bacterium]
MSVKIKDLPKSQKELIFEVSPDEMEKYMDKALNKMAKNIKVDGFREGRVPADMAKKQIGENAIFEEAIHIAIDDLYQKAIVENKLAPLGHPKADITKAALGNPLEFKILISVIPEVEIGDYKKVSGKIDVKEIKDEIVEKEIKTFQRKRAKYITKDEAAQKDDRVEIDFESRLSGVKVEGGESKNHPLTIGRGNFVPGFEDNLIGTKGGDVKEFDIVFPKDYHKKELAEKNVKFKVTMKIVQKVELAELNDEFAKSLGKFESMNMLRKSIKEGLFAEEKARAKEELRVDLIKQISDKSKVDIPEVLIEAEKSNMMNELKNNISQTGLDFETYLANIKTTEEKLRSEWNEPAEKRVKANLVIREISKQEELKVSEKEIDDKANETLKFYPNEQEIRKNIDIEKFKDYIAGMLVNEKVFEFLEGLAEKNAK